MKKTLKRPPGVFFVPWDITLDGKPYDYVTAATEEGAIEECLRKKGEVDRKRLSATLNFSFAGNSDLRIMVMPYKRVTEDGDCVVGIEAGWPNGETTYIEM